MTCIVAVGAYFAFEHTKSDVPDTVLEYEEFMTFSLTSPTFSEGGLIPRKYTCDGERISPELHIAHIPEGTVSLVLVMDDSDIPDAVKQRIGTEKFDHWVLYNIPKETTVLKEGEVVGTLGINSAGTSLYTGPCPPDREHRYNFRLYALSGTLNFIQAPTLDEVERAAQSMLLGKATLMGRYERNEIIQ